MDKKKPTKSKRTSFGIPTRFSLRKSLGGTQKQDDDVVHNKITTFKFTTPDFGMVDAEEAEAKRIEIARKVKETQEEALQDTKAMQFQPTDPRMKGYHSAFSTADMVQKSIGGMIILHQYCYKMYRDTKCSIFRDGANFFRDADYGCISIEFHAPIRMVEMDLMPVEEVEEWYRDYYSSRDVDLEKVADQYSEDTPTLCDKAIEELGRNVHVVMCEEMEKLENYCAAMFKATEKDIYELGIQFWRKASPSHLPRNYRLALILGKKRNWHLETTEQWFRMLYTEKFWVGARSKDVYPVEKNFGTLV
ncbi:hypothetical protein CAEBREN_10407 [Caenorhabditis brenneri]|uniref:Uncharacterized protein n=1 Tax=Caenorhabditis brenneri TaxID=135651 RepID=G0MSS2_CAEBE|nr:hypothetical protein CAEBREN_10407 [Caenorhabditis brenneri]